MTLREPRKYPPRRALNIGAGQVPRPVVALDIDGTLAAWHGHFLVFAEMYLGREMPSTLDWDGSVPFWKFMGVSRDTYRAMKLAFRQGGWKRSMVAYPGASELTKTLRGQGAEVWICTTRPYLRLDNIDPDTRHWLRRNQIQYDGVIFGERKYKDLVQLVGVGRIVGVLDDLPEMYDQAGDLGLRPFLRSQPYNEHFRYVDRVRGLCEASVELSKRLTQYEQNTDAA